MTYCRVFRILVAAMLLASACGGDDGGEATGTQPTGSPEAGAPAPYDDPILVEGQELFEGNCAACHGVDLQGTQAGPPFLHEVYVPSHHPDEAFFAAVENGVQPHHWDFGAMPPVQGLERDEVAAIVAYVRARQEDAGFVD